MTVESEWFERASAAEAAVQSRHQRRLWGIPGTRLGAPHWPPTRSDKMFVSWNFWWQAHLVDCAIDAALRQKDAWHRERVAVLIRGLKIRNFGSVTNDYYDDMAWLALSLLRAQAGLLLENHRALATLTDQFLDAWVPHVGGGIPWRKQDLFFNAPANGPAGIYLARTDNRERAEEMSDWIFRRLRDRETGLIIDGVRADGSTETAIHTYCQGVALGLETELAQSGGDQRHGDRVAELVNAVSAHLTTDGVLDQSGGGDGGLFNGITLRYLAGVATDLPGDSGQDDDARRLAGDIVLRTAEKQWKSSVTVEGLPLFSADATRLARVPGREVGVGVFSSGSVRTSDVPERDLSVQLSSWMAMEAAYRVSLHTDL